MHKSVHYMRPIALTMAPTYATICVTVESEKEEMPILLEMVFLVEFLPGSGILVSP